MHAEIRDEDLRRAEQQLMLDLKAFPEGLGSLDHAFESAAKHMPAYLKIVKGHIDQLAKVLEMETHEHRKLENVGLAEPVTQLMQLFRDLDEEDIQMLEGLAYEARHWQMEQRAEEKRATAAA